MRKWVYFLVVVIILGVFSAAYYVTGVRAEEEFDKFLKTANALPNLKVSADDYQRGWLKSTVNLHVELNPLMAQPALQGSLPVNQLSQFPQTISFSFKMDLYHGPIIFANGRMVFGLGLAETKVSLPNEILNQFNQFFAAGSTKPTFIISLLIRYAGKLEANLSIPPFALTSNDNAFQVNWKGFDGRWEIWRKLARIKGDVKFQGLIFKAGDINTQVGPTDLKYNVTNEESNLLSGKASLGLESLKLTSNALSPVDINGLEADSDSNITEKDGVRLIDSSLKADVRKVSYQGLDYGPGVLDVVVSNLDADALEKIQQKFQAESNQNLTDAQQQIFLLTLLPEVSQLLQRGAELHLKQFQLAIPQGLIFATGKVILPAEQNHSNNPFEVLQQIRAYVKAELPISWVSDRLATFLEFKIQQHQLMDQQVAQANDSEQSPAKSLSVSEVKTLAKQQADEQLQVLVQNNVLIPKDSVYQIKMTFRNGSFYINGKPFNNKQLEGVNDDSAN